MLETPPAWIRTAAAALALCLGPRVGCLEGRSAALAAGERSAQGAWSGMPAAGGAA